MYREHSGQRLSNQHRTRTPRTTTIHENFFLLSVQQQKQQKQNSSSLAALGMWGMGPAVSNLARRTRDLRKLFRNNGMKHALFEHTHTHTNRRCRCGMQNENEQRWKWSTRFFFEYFFVAFVQFRLCSGEFRLAGYVRHSLTHSLTVYWNFLSVSILFVRKMCTQLTNEQIICNTHDVLWLVSEQNHRKHNVKRNRKGRRNGTE